MNKRVIDLLNQARAHELGVISQYMIHHYELEDKDYGKLASTLKEIAITEMKHAEKLSDRILFLNGEPISRPAGESVKGQEITDMLKTDIGLEANVVALYNEAAVLCTAEKDQVSKDLFEELLRQEEGHLDTFENIRDLIGTLGAPYLVSLTGK
ncbi:MAG: bacterioferritin [Syntrophorhabdales bacterium]|jgi:bacterioferritin